MIKYIDLTHSIENLMPVFPGDRNVILEQTHFVARNGNSNFRLDAPLHIGTHIDSPSHFLTDGKRISEIPIEQLCGKGILVDVRDKSEIGIECLANIEITAGSILVFCSEYFKNWGSDRYYHDYPVLSKELCEYLSDKKINMICLDTPSPDKSPYENHPIFFNAGILIAENLTNTDQLLGIGEFMIYALPLKINSCGSPARIIAQYEI